MPTIGKVRVDLEGNTRQFQRSMRQASSSVERFGGLVRNLQARIGVIAGALGFGVLARRTGEEAVRMKQLADRIGTNIESFSRLSRVLQRSGISLDQSGVILQRLQRRAAEAAAGNEQLAAVFEELGIDVQAFVRLDPVEAFLQFARALARVDNNARKLLLGFKVLDTEGVQVLQTDLTRLREAMAATSGITESQAEAVTKAAEAWDKMAESVRSALLALGERTGAFRLATEYFEGVERLTRQPAARTFRQVLESLVGQMPVIGEDLARIASGRTAPKPGAPPVQRMVTGPGQSRLFTGGDLSTTNAILEAIRRNTEVIEGAQFQ